jgi:hypothetical protein
VSASALAPWQRPGVLVVDADTGVSYVYVSGRLRPPANRVSADLILGTPKPQHVSVPHATVVATGVGPTVGIGAAPVLPSSGALLGGALAICSVSGQATSSVVFPSVAGQVGDAGFTGFVGLSGGNGLSTNDVVATNRGADYLIWNRIRYPISDPVHVFAAYKWTGVVTVALPDDVLATLPTGAAITPTALSLKPPKPLRLAAPATMCVSLNADGIASHTLINAQVSRLAGTFALPSSGATLLRTSPSAATTYLLLGSGSYYPIPGGASALASLGLGSSPVSVVPPSVLGLLRAGPVLSRQAALAG